MGQEYTKGEWKVKEVKEGDDNIHFVDHTDEYHITNEDGVECIATMGTGWASGNAEANAQLIASAVNACIRVNPDNPQAAADGISDLYEACRYQKNRCTEIMEGYNQGLTPEKVDWAGIVGGADKRVRQALAKTEGK